MRRRIVFFSYSPPRFWAGGTKIFFKAEDANLVDWAGVQSGLRLEFHGTNDTTVTWANSNDASYRPFFARLEVVHHNSHVADFDWIRLVGPLLAAHQSR